jgi:hypothetical protein
LIQKSVDKNSRAFFNQAFRSQTSRKALKNNKSTEKKYSRFYKSTQTSKTAKR